MAARSARATFVVVAAVVAAAMLAIPATATSRVAFSRSGDIFTVEPDGSSARRITRRAATEHMPTWSPDQGRIARTVAGSACDLSGHVQRRDGR